MSLRILVTVPPFTSSCVGLRITLILDELPTRAFVSCKINHVGGIQGEHTDEDRYLLLAVGLHITLILEAMPTEAFASGRANQVGQVQGE